MVIRAHTFRLRDLVAGHIVLDLVNTVTARNADPVDWLDGYARLLEWAALTGEFEPAVLRALARQSTAAPRAAAGAVRRTRALRETLLALFTALIEGERPPAAALQQLEKHWKHAAAHVGIGVAKRTIGLRLSVDGSGLAYLDHHLALASLDLFATLPVERTRICPGLRCGWLFIDRSKGGQRRWCDMATCGNAAKSRAHSLRQTRKKRGHRAAG
jgi:predicted RNA-binding Zn ribbon-like protein